VRAVDLDAATRALMAPVCRDCTWWQSPAPASTVPAQPASPPRSADEAPTGVADHGLRPAWEQEVLAVAGLFGRLLTGDDGEAVGWMHAAPCRLLPRVADLPAGRPAPDTWLLTCAYFHDEEFLAGFQRLLHDLINALRRRDVATIEAYGLRSQDAGDRFRGYLREVNLFNAGVLEGSGFHRVATAGVVGRYRLETRTLLSAPRHAMAPESLATRPATIPT
jgi:hypothetical protein